MATKLHIVKHFSREKRQVFCSVINLNKSNHLPRQNILRSFATETGGGDDDLGGLAPAK